MVAWLFEALWYRARGLRDPGTHAEGQCALVLRDHRKQRTHALRPTPLLTEDDGAGMHDIQSQTGSHGGITLREGVEFQAFQDSTQWAWAAAVTLSAALRRALEAESRVRLLLSGGRTPAPAYAALARAPLAWDRVDVALVDERWLLPDDPDANARLVRESLLAENAAAARFEAITCPGRSFEEAVTIANMHAAHA